jgi:hypothetical protein
VANPRESLNWSRSRQCPGGMAPKSCPGRVPPPPRGAYFARVMPARPEILAPGCEVRHIPNSLIHV